VSPCGHRAVRSFAPLSSRRRTSQPSATRCPTPLEASTCCRFRTRTQFPQNVFRRIANREIAPAVGTSEIGLISSAPHTYLMRPPSPVTSMSWKLPSHETASAGSHRQRAVLGISDRRLQPTLFKDEHPRSGRSLAWLHPLARRAGQLVEGFTAPTCFGGSSGDTVAFSSDRTSVRPNL
jgi:hypothetical protein